MLRQLSCAARIFSQRRIAPRLSMVCALTLILIWLILFWRILLWPCAAPLWPAALVAAWPGKTSHCPPPRQCDRRAHENPKASVQPEHPVDRFQLGGLHQLGMRNCDGDQRPFQLGLPEGEKILQRRKVRKQIVVLPDIGLQQPTVIGTAVENFGRRQAITGELLLEVLRDSALADNALRDRSFRDHQNLLGAFSDEVAFRFVVENATKKDVRRRSAKSGNRFVERARTHSFRRESREPDSTSRTNALFENLDAIRSLITSLNVK